MLTNSEIELGSRAVINLHGFFVITNTHSIIDNPKIVVKCLQVSELFVMEYFDNLSPLDKLIVEEDLIRDNVCEIYNHEGETISLEYTPAGIITSIASAILNLSLKYLINDDGVPYAQHYERISYLENMQAIVSYYLQIPYGEVVKLPLNELFHKHAICARAFPNQVLPLLPVDETATNGE